MVKIVSDSSTLYTKDEAAAKNFDVSMLAVTIKGTTYKELEEISTEKFIELIDEGNVPKSSQPAIGDVVELYEKYKDDEIINITMADGLSGTYHSACIAKNMVDNSENIEVVNSKTLCGPHRYMVEVAARLANEGKSKKEILDVLDIMIGSTRSYLIPVDYDFLVRGGRLSHLAGRIGSAIKLVPVMVVSEDGGKIEKFCVKRTFSRSIEKVADQFLEDKIDSSYKIIVGHACAEAEGILVKTIISKKIENADIDVIKLGPAFTTQGGPECISIQYVKKINE